MPHIYRKLISISISGALNVYNKTTATGSNGVPTALVKPNFEGKPNFLTLTAENKVHNDINLVMMQLIIGSDFAT